MKTDTLIAELKAKYGHIVPARQIKTAAEHFGDLIEALETDEKKEWNVLPLLRSARYSKKYSLASAVISKTKCTLGAALIVHDSIYGDFRVALPGERFAYLETKARAILKKCCEAVDAFNEYEAVDNETMCQKYETQGLTFRPGILTHNSGNRAVLMAELRDRMYALTDKRRVRFTRLTRTYESTPDGRYRRVKTEREEIEFSPTSEEKRRGHERAASMKIHAGKTETELKKPLKGEKLWAYRYHNHD